MLPHGAIRILQELAASEEVQLAILNNEARELNDYRIERFRLGSYFDVFLSSCYLGLRKPDAKIYRLALDVLHREPEEVVFIDDREGNCAAAEAWEFTRFAIRMRHNACRRWSGWAEAGVQAIGHHIVSKEQVPWRRWKSRFLRKTCKAAQSPEHIPGPTSVVIFGASGDLTKRKLLPALFHLEQAGLLPAEFAVTGVARRPLEDEFRKDMSEGILEFGGVKEDDATAGGVH